MHTYRFLLIISLIFITSCVQRDPNPEQSDIIHRDLKKELDLMQKNIADVEMEYESRLADLKSVVPQTGQIKTYEKKVFESKNNLERLKQQEQYFKISVLQRKEYVQKRYEESFRGGRPWPDLAEIEIFEKSQKLQRDKIAWDKNKGMIKNVPRGTSDEPKKEPTEAN